MVIQLHIKYKTQYGQAIYLLVYKSSSENSYPAEIPMQYLNEEYWNVSIETNDLGLKDILFYNYIIKEAGKGNISDLSKERSVSFKKKKASFINVFDEWQVEPLYENVFLSKPFEKVFRPVKIKSKKDNKSKKHTHIFKAFVPSLRSGLAVCIAGSPEELNQWSEDEPVLLTWNKDSWYVHLNLQKEIFPISYKFGVYDLELNQVIHFEDGENRVILYAPVKDLMDIYHCYPVFNQYKWKGAGINVPVSAIKTSQSWGVGDFTDLHLLIDWASSAGFRLIQLLPINDTTATHTFKDSYPYASISAFALHPLYLNVMKLSLAASIEIPEEVIMEINRLNALPKLDYLATAAVKFKAVQALYFKEKDVFRDDLDFFEFFALNRSWLVPYAAFCYLRDQNNNPDPAQWDDFNLYAEEEIQELVSPDNAHYDEIAIHYFIQYHLHLQLLDAVAYAHKKGIVLKGDLPIGVGRYSVETWIYPRLFHMDMQAGAPPDAFAVKGQNWEFPTYNWEEMGKDNYSWWRQRMEQISNYFDAIRIDHILGFFRIWSIPQKDIEGILGIFMPSLPLGIDDFKSAGLFFDEKRFIQPYINDDVLAKHFPGNEAWVKENILDNYEFKSRLDNQHKLAAYFKNNPGQKHLLQGLLDLITEVILIRDFDQPDHFHFRINMHLTDSYNNLDADQRQKLDKLYQRYFFTMQDDLWKKVGQEKLNALQFNTSMLLCAEDLGMVPDFVENVLITREILSLQVQRMPKKIGENFSHPRNAIYLSVATPSTHDMSTIRQWWEDDKENIQYFYNYLMAREGIAPFYCEPWICTEIIRQHLESPAMWAIFLLQDIMAMDGNIRRENPSEERINVPADPNHHWDYRMHITIEDLIASTSLTQKMALLIKENGR